MINVGIATLGALIGAGGYGQPILTGIRLDNISLILEGAVPAAVLALLVQGLFDAMEYYIRYQKIYNAEELRRYAIDNFSYDKVGRKILDIYTRY